MSFFNRNNLGALTRAKLRNAVNRLPLANAASRSKNSYLTAHDIANAQIQNDGLGFLRDYIVHPPAESDPAKLKLWYESTAAKSGGTLNSRYNTSTGQYDIVLPGFDGSSGTSSGSGTTASGTIPFRKPGPMPIYSQSPAAGEKTLVTVSSSDQKPYQSMLLPVAGPPMPIKDDPQPQAATSDSMAPIAPAGDSLDVTTVSATSGSKFGLLLLLAIPAAYFASKR